MALADTFESYADGTDLDATTDWETLGLGGSGVLRIDTHTDHQPGQVVDMSTTGTQIGVHQTLVGGNDHSVEVVAFPDTMVFAGGTCGVGVLLRGSSTTVNATWDGYRVQIIRDGDASSTTVTIDRYDNTSAVQLATTGDIDGTYAAGVVHTLRGEIDGTVITAYVDDTEVLSYDTSGDGTVYSAGQAVGVYIGRNYTGDGINAQPFLDDFAADVLATGAVEVNPVGAVSVPVAGTADVSGTADVDLVGAVSTSVAGTADVSGTADVDPVGAVSASVAGTGDVSATADVDPTGAVSASVAGTADVSSAGQINPIGATSTTVTGTADVSGQADIAPTGAVSTTVTGTASITGTADVDPVGAVSTTVAGTADVTSGTAIEPVGAVSATASATADITGVADITPVGAVSLTFTGTANIGTTPLADDTYHADLYRERSRTAAYRETATAAVHRERTVANTYRAETHGAPR